LFKSINAKSRIAKSHSHETLEESGKASRAMDWTSADRQTEITFADENAFDSICRNNEPDLMKTYESDSQ
jgi:hypothetical protein